MVKMNNALLATAAIVLIAAPSASAIDIPVPGLGLQLKLDCQFRALSPGVSGSTISGLQKTRCTAVNSKISWVATMRIQKAVGSSYTTVSTRRFTGTSQNFVTSISAPCSRVALRRGNLYSVYTSVKIKFTRYGAPKRYVVNEQMQSPYTKLPCR